MQTLANGSINKNSLKTLSTLLKSQTSKSQECTVVANGLVTHLTPRSSVGQGTSTSGTGTNASGTGTLPKMQIKRTPSSTQGTGFKFHSKIKEMVPPCEY